MAKGRKTGGRHKGTKNKATLLVEEAARMALSTAGALPLDCMLAIMRDETQPAERRFTMAKAAAPYCHARLKPVTPPPQPAMIELTCEEVEAEIVEILRRSGVVN
jgi:hypothetical protein